METITSYLEGWHYSGWTFSEIDMKILDCYNLLCYDQRGGIELYIQLNVMQACLLPQDPIRTATQHRHNYCIIVATLIIK